MKRIIALIACLMLIPCADAAYFAGARARVAVRVRAPVVRARVAVTYAPARQVEVQRQVLVPQYVPIYQQFAVPECGSCGTVGRVRVLVR